MLRFSIVIPNYNSGSVLERCVKSLLAQDYAALQLIMADAGSTDESREVIERYRDAFDVLISEPDDGQADGLNKGFARATGDVVGWLCADDELLPGALKHAAEIFERDAADVVIGASERVHPDMSTVICWSGPDPWGPIHIKDVIDQPSTFWRRELHERLAPLETSYYMAFDWDLWIRMCNSGAKAATTDRVLSRHYFTETNKVGCAGNLFAEEAYRIIKKYGPLQGWLADIYRILYYRFDLKGCLDRPATCSRFRWLFYWWTRVVLRLLIGGRLLGMYNWHFAALQERGLKWWK